LDDGFYRHGAPGGACKRGHGARWHEKELFSEAPLSGSLPDRSSRGERGGCPDCAPARFCAAEGYFEGDGVPALQAGGIIFLSLIPGPALCFSPGYNISGLRPWGRGSDTLKRGHQTPQRDAPLVKAGKPHLRSEASARRSGAGHRSRDCLKTPTSEAQSKKRPPHLRYGAFFFMAKVF
jgi:hypothetical protein